MHPLKQALVKNLANLGVFLCLWTLLPLRAQADYCVILDAGSSGSRAHVFHYLRSPAGGLPLVQEKGSGLKNKQPLSSFAAKPQLAGNSLGALLEYAGQQVPKEEQAASTIHLLATAGLRLLQLEVVQAIFEACREVLERSVFSFQRDWALIVPGSSEGLYGFVSANYASGALQKWATLPSTQDSPEFWGVIELGGASLQVTYRANESALSSGNDQYVYQLPLAGQTLSLFTHSFLGFGQDAAMHLSLSTAAQELAQSDNLEDMKPEEVSATTVADPCLPLGFQGSVDAVRVFGLGSFSDCSTMSSRLVKRDCLLETCGLGGLLMPPPSGKLLCIENLQYTAGFLGLPHASTLRELHDAASAVCGMGWDEMVQKYTSFEQEHLMWYCFGAAYGLALMQEGLGIDLDSDRLFFTDKIASPSGQQITLDWTLGAVVVAAASSSGFASLGKEFAQMRRLPEGHHVAPRGIPAYSAVIAVIMVLGLVAVAIVNVTPARWRRIARTTKKLRKLVKKNSAIVFPNDYSDDEESDSEPQWRCHKPGSSLIVGRRQNSTRTADIESGVESV